MSEPTGARRYGVGGGDAYYDAVRYGGYEGTREQFGKDQAEFAKNASAVAEAKETVERDTEEVRNTKNTFENTTVPEAIRALNQEGEDQILAITQKGEEVSQQVETVGTEQKDAVANEGRARVEAVEQAGTDQVQAVNDAGTTQVGNVNQAGEDQVDAVEQAGADQVQAVTDEGTTQVGAVNRAGSAQVQAVEDKGDEVLHSIPSDYTELVEDVDNLKSALTFVGNSFDSSTATTGKSFNSSGTIVDLEVAFITDYIPVQPGIKVSTNMSLGSSYYYHVIYNSSKIIIDKYKSNNDNMIMTMPPNAAFIRLTGVAASISTTYVNLETAKLVSAVGEKVTDIGNRLESAEDSIQNLEFGISGIYDNDLNKYFYHGEPSGTRYITVYFSPAIPAGKYSFACSNVDSTDTQHTVSRVIFYNGSTQLAVQDISRTQGVDTAVTLASPCDAINFYGATSWSDSDGVTFTFNNVRIYKASQLENRLSENELIVDTSKMNNLNNTNIFRFGKYFSHLGVDKTSNIIIPSQSLADVSRAKRLGFKAVELNVRLTSDNKFVCIHGSFGNFGYQFEGLNGEDVHATAINSMTLAEIKSGIRFKSIYSKYKTAPFSLSEMLHECKRQNIIPIVEYQPTYPQYGFFDVLDSVMGKDNYIVNLYNVNRSGITNAPCVSWLSITDSDELVAKCKASDGSYCASLNVTDAAYSSFTKSDWEGLSDAVHAEGYLIGFAEYVPVATSILLESCGFDVVASLHSINEFDCGNICNLDGGADFNDFETTGTVSSANLVLTTGDTVAPQNQLDDVFLGGGILRIRFDGDITLSFGQMITNVALSSDGANEITLSTFFEEESPNFEIVATSNTTIYELSYKASRM